MFYLILSRFVVHTTSFFINNYTVFTLCALKKKHFSTNPSIANLQILHFCPCFTWDCSKYNSHSYCFSSVTQLEKHGNGSKINSFFFFHLNVVVKRKKEGTYRCVHVHSGHPMCMCTIATGSPGFHYTALKY